MVNDTGEEVIFVYCKQSQGRKLLGVCMPLECDVCERVEFIFNLTTEWAAMLKGNKIFTIFMAFHQICVYIPKIPDKNPKYYLLLLYYILVYIYYIAFILRLCFRFEIPPNFICLEQLLISLRRNLVIILKF